MNHKHLCPGCMEDRGVEQACPHCGFEPGSAQVSANHLPPGSVLQEKYLLGRVLGQGGFGITYLAWDTRLDLKLAVKEYFPLGMAARLPGSSEQEKRPLTSY